MFTVSLGLTSNLQDSVSSLLTKGIYDRSPLGRYERQDFSPGIKLLRSESRCVEPDLIQLFQLQSPRWKVRLPNRNESYRDSVDHPRTRDLSIDVSNFEDALVTELSAQLSLFRDQDAVAKEREICVTAAEFSRPNAVSIGMGFLAFDPRLFFSIAQREDTDEWAMRAILAHELAHQFQIWHQDPTLFRRKDGRPFARDKELQADCVAAGILRQQFVSVAPLDAPEPVQSIGTAFIAVGDFKIDHFETHHGTAYERSLMAQTGIKKAAERAATGGAVTSKHLLDFCRMSIDSMNLKFGNEIWPFGSRLD
jgi:hypothetical protein